MWLPFKYRPIILCPSLSFSLGLWGRLTKTYKFKSSHTPLAPLFQNPNFTLGFAPQTFNWWINKGLLCIADFFDHKGILTKQFLIKKYQLPKSEFSQYYRIVYFIMSLTCNLDITSMTPMELCKNVDKLKVHISILYCILTSIPAKLGYMEPWERDLN